MTPTQKRHIDSLLAGVPEDAIATGQAVRAAWDARIADEPVLADMAKTIVANARALARKLGFDPDSPAVLSELARARLQGFPDGWVFHGKHKRTRNAQIGMAMPPALAAAIATSIVNWRRVLAYRDKCADEILAIARKTEDAG